MDVVYIIKFLYINTVWRVMAVETILIIFLVL